MPNTAFTKRKEELDTSVTLILGDFAETTNLLSKMRYKAFTGTTYCALYTQRWCTTMPMTSYCICHFVSFKMTTHDVWLAIDNLSCIVSRMVTRVDS